MSADYSDEDFYWTAKFDGSGNMIWYQLPMPDICNRIDLADGSLHRSGDVFVALNTEDSDGIRYMSWGIRIEELP